MEAVTYIVITLICAACAALLLRGFRRDRIRLLLWSGMCFVGLAVSNFLVYLDLVVFKRLDLYPVRLFAAAVAMSLILFGLIWESG